MFMIARRWMSSSSSIPAQWHGWNRLLAYWLEGSGTTVNLAIRKRDFMKLERNRNYNSNNTNFHLVWKFEIPPKKIRKVYFLKKSEVMAKKITEVCKSRIPKVCRVKTYQRFARNKISKLRQTYIQLVCRKNIEVWKKTKVTSKKNIRGSSKKDTQGLLEKDTQGWRKKYRRFVIRLFLPSMPRGRERECIGLA